MTFNIKGYWTEQCKDQKIIKGSSFILPYSREQKHVSISDTPMLLIEINSISDMGCQK